MVKPWSTNPPRLRPTEDSAGAEAWSDTPKTWRQRVRCLEHLAERGGRGPRAQWGHGMADGWCFSMCFMSPDVIVSLS